jgi:hypothetical protein
MKTRLLFLAITIMLLSTSCTPRGAKDAAKKQVYDWWYAYKLGENRAVLYDGGWIDNWRHPLINLKHTKLKTNKEKTRQAIYFWFEREEYKKVDNVVKKETESDNMIVCVFRYHRDGQWEDWRVQKVDAGSRYSHSDAEDTFNDYK